MALNVEFVQHTEYLEIIVTGTYDMEDAIDKFPRVLAACRNTKIAKALIDFRRLGGIVHATEKVLYAWKIEEHYRNHLSTGGQNLQIAYVGQSPLVSTYEPGVEIVESMGLPFALFEDSRKALEWLGVKADIPPSIKLGPGHILRAAVDLYLLQTPPLDGATISAFKRFGETRLMTPMHMALFEDGSART